MVDKAVSAIHQSGIIYPHLIVLEAPRLIIAEKDIPKVKAVYNCCVAADNGGFRERHSLPAGEPVWAFLSGSSKVEAWGKCDDAGLLLLKEELEKNEHNGISIQKISGVPIQEDGDDLLHNPRINSGNAKFLAIGDRKENHGFILDRKTGKIWARLKIPQADVVQLLQKGEKLFDSSVPGIAGDPVQLSQLHIIDDTTLVLCATVNVVRKQYSYESLDTLKIIDHFALIGRYDLKTGKGDYKRLEGARSIQRGFSSVLKDSTLIVGSPSGLRIEGDVSDYSKYTVLVKVNINTARVTSSLTVDSVYIENDLRGNFLITYLTSDGENIYAASSLSDIICNINSNGTIPIRTDPFVSQRTLFKEHRLPDSLHAQRMKESNNRINSIPLKCQVEEIRSLNDSILAVAFIVTQGDLRKRHDSSNYFLQFINTHDRSSIGTIRLPIDCPKGEALNALLDATEMNEGRLSFTLVIKTPENYRMDTYALYLNHSPLD